MSQIDVQYPIRIPPFGSPIRICKKILKKWRPGAQDERVRQDVAVRKLYDDVRRGCRHWRVEDGAEVGVQTRRLLTTYSALQGVGHVLEAKHAREGPKIAHYLRRRHAAPR